MPISVRAAGGEAAVSWAFDLVGRRAVVDVRAATIVRNTSPRRSDLFIHLHMVANRGAIAADEGVHSRCSRPDALSCRPTDRRNDWSSKNKGNNEEPVHGMTRSKNDTHDQHRDTDQR